MENTDEIFMRLALAMARKAATNKEVPVGAIAVIDGEVISQSSNMPITTQDPTAHAEILVLRKAAKRLNNYRLPGLAIYVTLEPCAMCYGAMVHARVERLIFGAADFKSGVLGGAISFEACTNFNHRIDVVGGVLEKDCSALLKDFFASKRGLK